MKLNLTKLNLVYLDSLLRSEMIKEISGKIVAFELQTKVDSVFSKDVEKPRVVEAKEDLKLKVFSYCV